MSFATLLDACDALIVAAPVEAHCPLAEAALGRGRHVLIEKPIAATLVEADRLIALAAERGRVLQVGHLLRYSAEHRAITERITRPLYIEATRIAPFKPRGTDVSVILDLMIHDLDLVLAIVDSPIEDVDALGAAVSSAHEDIANARVRFANGCVAHHHGQPDLAQDRAADAAVLRRGLPVGRLRCPRAHHDRPRARPEAALAPAASGARR